MKEEKTTQRNYVITSSEIKKACNIQGDIKAISSYSGRSIQDMEDNISADEDEWEIQTEEHKQEAEK